MTLVVNQPTACVWGRGRHSGWCGAHTLLWALSPGADCWRLGQAVGFGVGAPVALAPRVEESGGEAC